MCTMSHVITPNNITLHGLITSSSTRCSYGYSHSSPILHTLKSTRVCNKVGVSAQFKSQDSTPKCTTAIDFSDPDWKTKFKEDFEARFRLPHVTDIFHDAAPMPSTFCLQMRLVVWIGLLLPLQLLCWCINVGLFVFCFACKNCLLFFWCVCYRTGMTRDFAGNYPCEEWQGYINDNDRVLLKVCSAHPSCCLSLS